MKIKLRKKFTLLDEPRKQIFDFASPGVAGSNMGIGL